MALRPPNPKRGQPVFIDSIGLRTVLATIAVLTVAHFAKAILPIETVRWLTLAYGFVPAHYTVSDAYLLPGRGGLARESLNFLSYALLHGGLMHLGANVLATLVFGVPLARRTGAGGFLALFALGAIGGAAAFLVSNIGDFSPLIGASGATAALLGALVRFALGPRSTGAPEPPENGFIIFLAIYWLVANLAPAIFDPLAGPGNIAWQAHIGGFITGFALGPLFRMASAR